MGVFEKTVITNSGDELPAVHIDGTDYILGALVPQTFGAGYPRFSEVMASRMLSQDQWVEFDRTLTAVPILDQGQHGSCVGHGAVSGLMKSRAKMGQKFVLLSPTFTYAQINGGRDSGAVVSAAMTSLLSTGTATMEEVPESIIYARDIKAHSATAYTTASRFKAGECYHLDSFDALGSAVQLGFDIVFGINVGGRFTLLDSEGVPGVGGTGGHCLCDGEGMKKSQKWGWLIKTRNSWRTSYGLGGFCWLAKAHFEAWGGLDAFAIWRPILDPQDVDEPSAVAA